MAVALAKSQSQASSSAEVRAAYQQAAQAYVSAREQGSPTAINRAHRLALAVQTLKPGHLPTLNLLAKIALLMEDSDAARQWVSTGLSIKPASPGLLFTAGKIEFEQGRLDAAEALFLRSSRISKVATEAPLYLADCRFLSGQKEQAFLDYAELLKTHGQSPQLKTRLFDAAAQLKVDIYDPDLVQDLLRYLSFKEMDSAQLGSLVFSSLKLEFHQLEQQQALTISALSQSQLLYTSLRQMLFTDAQLEPLLSDVRRTLLLESARELKLAEGCHTLISALAWQCWHNEGCWPENHQETGLIAKLQVLADRLLKISRPQQEDQSALLNVLALILMYRPLNQLLNGAGEPTGHQLQKGSRLQKESRLLKESQLRKGLQDLVDALREDTLSPQHIPVNNPTWAGQEDDHSEWPADLLTLIQANLDEWQDLADASQQLISHTSSASEPTSQQDIVSSRVAQQYDQHPYPRWTALGNYQKTHYGKALKRLFPGRLADCAISVRANLDNPLKVLVAGCGTGRHALRLARFFEPLEVTAIDLSLKALSWAQMRANALRVPLTLRHLDLRKVADLGQTFDVIECSGVLHHMPDPLAGLKALAGVLAPGGIIKIALYSSTAREQISRLRSMMLSSEASGDLFDGPNENTGSQEPSKAAVSPAIEDASLRQLRYGILNGDVAQALGGDWQPVLESADFYSLSGCRDLLCHEQEITFDIEQIEQTLLKPAGLNWVGLLPPAGFNASQPASIEMAMTGASATRTRQSDSASIQAILNPAEEAPAFWAEQELNNPRLFSGMYQIYAMKPRTPVDQTGGSSGR